MPIKTQIAERIMNEINSYIEKKDNLDAMMNLSAHKDRKSVV